MVRECRSIIEGNWKPDRAEYEDVMRVDWLHLGALWAGPDIRASHSRRARVALAVGSARVGRPAVCLGRWMGLSPSRGIENALRVGCDFSGLRTRSRYRCRH
jgi:hypothetical protein